MTETRKLPSLDETGCGGGVFCSTRSVSPARVFRERERFEAWVEVAKWFGDGRALEIGSDFLQEAACSLFRHVAVCRRTRFLELLRVSERGLGSAAGFQIEPWCMGANRLIEVRQMPVEPAKGVFLPTAVALNGIPGKIASPVAYVGFVAYYALGLFRAAEIVVGILSAMRLQELVKAGGIRRGTTPCLI